MKVGFSFTNHSWKLALHTPAGRRKIFSLPGNTQAMRNPQLSQHESDITLNSCSPSLNICSKTMPPSFLLPSIKDILLLWFALVCMSRIAILLLFPNKLIFAA